MHTEERYVKQRSGEGGLGTTEETQRTLTVHQSFSVKISNLVTSLRMAMTKKQMNEQKPENKSWQRYGDIGTFAHC